MGGPHGTKPGQSLRPRAVPALLVKEHEVPLAEGETLIGRGAETRIAILGSLVSRKHARLVCTNGRVTVEDLGSRNGVFVNGVKLDAPAMLEDGDTLLIGTTQLTYFLGTADEGGPARGRAIFDEQGNMVPESEAGPDWNTRTAIRFETESEVTVDFDREDVTIQGSRPPSPRSSSALLQKPETKTEPPPTPRAKDPTAPGSGPVAKLQLGRMGSSGPASRPRQSAPPPLVGPVARHTPIPSRPTPGQTPFPPTPAARRTPFPSVPAPGRSGSFSVPGQDPLLAALSVIDRMLARGDADAAGRALSGHLAKRVQGAASGTPLGAPLLEQASFRCLSLLELGGDPCWFDAVVELHTVARAPMTHAVLDRLSPFAGVVPSASQGLLFEYQGIVRDLLGEVDVSGLEACERILSLGE